MLYIHTPPRLIIINDLQLKSFRRATREPLKAPLILMVFEAFVFLNTVKETATHLSRDR